MNRRSFLQRLGYGAVATLALASVPASVVKAIGLQEPAKRYACEEMRRIYNEYTRGGRMPDYMLVGSDLYDAYENELIACERFTAAATTSGFYKIPSITFKGIRYWFPQTPNLMFKGTRAFRSDRRGWWATCQQGSRPR